MITIRQAAPKDARAIGAVWLDAWRVGYRGIVPDAAIDRRSDEEADTYWRAALIDPARAPYVFVAEVPKEGVVGFVQAGPQDEPREAGYEMEIWKLYIRPAYHGQGIGRRLMSAIADQLAQHGLTSVMLRAFAGNAASGFYERLGGQCLGTAAYEILAEQVPTVLYGWPDLAALRTPVRE
jgi:ribosomal protein S18 acetylase RimI-like enzyme